MRAGRQVHQPELEVNAASQGSCIDSINALSLTRGNFLTIKQEEGMFPVPDFREAGESASDQGASPSPPAVVDEGMTSSPRARTMSLKKGPFIE